LRQKMALRIILPAWRRVPVDVARALGTRWRRSLGEG